MCYYTMWKLFYRASDFRQMRSKEIDEQSSDIQFYRTNLEKYKYYNERTHAWITNQMFWEKISKLKQKKIKQESFKNKRNWWTNLDKFLQWTNPWVSSKKFLGKF